MIPITVHWWSCVKAHISTCTHARTNTHTPQSSIYRLTPFLQEMPFHASQGSQNRKMPQKYDLLRPRTHELFLTMHNPPMVWDSEPQHPCIVHPCSTPEPQHPASSTPAPPQNLSTPASSIPAPPQLPPIPNPQAPRKSLRTQAWTAKQTGRTQEMHHLYIHPTWKERSLKGSCAVPFVWL